MNTRLKSFTASINIDIGNSLYGQFKVPLQNELVKSTKHNVWNQSIRPLNMDVHNDIVRGALSPIRELLKDEMR